MKIIGSTGELRGLDCNLVKFMLASCPWIAECWDPESIGFMYLLDDSDINQVKSICAVPHIIKRNGDGNEDAMSIDLESFDHWEAPAFYDDITGYWNVVAILGEEYGCMVFLSSGFVASIPPLQERLKIIQRRLGLIYVSY